PPGGSGSSPGPDPGCRPARFSAPSPAARGGSSDRADRSSRSAGCSRPCGTPSRFFQSYKCNTRPGGRVCNRPCGLVNVFPVLALEQVGEHEEEGQEQQDVDTDALVIQLVRVCRVGQEGDQILDGPVELLGSLLAGALFDHQLVTGFLGDRRAGQRVELLLAVTNHLDL